MRYAPKRSKRLRVALKQDMLLRLDAEDTETGDFLRAVSAAWYTALWRKRPESDAWDVAEGDEMTWVVFHVLMRWGVATMTSRLLETWRDIQYRVLGPS